MPELGKIWVALGIDASKFHSELSKAMGSINNLGSGMSTLGKVAAGVGTAFAAIGIANFVKNVATTAARTQTLGVVLQQVGKTAGYSQKELTGYENAVKALGITTQGARESLIKMMQANLDLADASKLARVAQDAAVIAGENSTEAFNAMLAGITTLQPEILRTRRIVVNLEAAYKDFAKTQGVATTSLTTAQKQQIALNEVLKAGERIAGTYTAAMGTAGKQMLSLDRLIEEAKNTIGTVFLPAMSQAIVAISDFFKSLDSPAMKKAMENLGVTLGDNVKGVLGSVEKLIAAFSKLSPGAIEAAVKITGALIGGAGLLFALVKVHGAVTALKIAFAEMHLAALGPIALIVAALGGLAYAAYKGKQAIDNLIAGQEAGTEAAWKHAQAELELGKALLAEGQITQETYDELKAITDAHQRAYEAATGITQATKAETKAIMETGDAYSLLQRKIKAGNYAIAEGNEALYIYRKTLDLSGDSAEALASALAFLEPATKDVSDAWGDFIDQIEGFSESRIENELADLGREANRLAIEIVRAGGKGTDAAKKYEDELDDVETKMYLLGQQGDLSFGAQEQGLKDVANAAKTAEDAYQDILDAMRDIAGFAFPGEAALSDQLFAMEQDAKRLQLQMLEMGGRGAEGVEPLEKQLEELNRQMDILRLKGEITWDPQRRLIERMLEPIKEMGFGDKLDSILAISPESLNSLRMAAEQLGAQEAYIRALSGFEGISVSPNLGPQWEEWAAQRGAGGESLSLEDFSRHLAAIGAPSFQFGGRVPGPLGRPQLAVVHGGEEFAGVGRSVNNTDDHRALSVVVNQYGNQPNTADLFLSDSRLRRYFKARAEW